MGGGGGCLFACLGFFEDDNRIQVQITMNNNMQVIKYIFVIAIIWLKPAVNKVIFMIILTQFVVEPRLTDLCRLHLT